MNWNAVAADDFIVPDDVPLTDLTAELTRALGDPDPLTREDVARAALVTWIERGVYDDLMRGLGDGIAGGLRVGLGETGSTSVLRRCASVDILTAGILRDTQRPLVSGGTVLDWGDKIATWLLTEQDLRSEVPRCGRAAAVERGADALAALAGSPHLMAPELTVLLDVVAERLIQPGTPAFTSLEVDHLAAATMATLRREKMPFDIVEAWLLRVTEAPTPEAQHNTDAFARALYLQLALAPEPPSVRADLLLLLVKVLRHTNPRFLGSARIGQ